MTDNTLKILLSSNVRDGAERVNHLFRNAGQAVQTHRITSFEDLTHCLNDEHWDLALCEQHDGELDTRKVLEHIVGSNNDTPVILLTDDLTNEMIVEGLSHGAQDVIQASHHEHLLHAANREVKNLRIRRRYSELERSLEEVSGRFETLMSHADDAVAYILDGMHVDVNEAYAAIFDIDDRDEFLAIPMVDLIAEEDQEKFKVFSKRYSEESEQEISLQCLTPSGKDFTARIKLAPAVFDDEACTQLILRREDVTEASNELSLQQIQVDPSTGLDSRFGMVDQLDEFLADNTQGCLLYISINEFAQIKSRLGLSGSRAIRSEIADWLKYIFSDNESTTISHYGEESFTVLLPNTADNEAMISAKNLCVNIEQQIFEVEQQTAQCSCCVGVVDLSKSRFKSSSEAMDSAFVALEEARQLYAQDNSIPGIILFTPGSTGDSVEINYDVRELVAAQHLRMVFQPVINLHGDPIESYESTLRLLNSEGHEQAVDGLIQSVNQKPGDTSLDKWLVVEGSKNLKSHRRSGKQTVLTINLTQNALIDETFSSWLGVAMKAAQLSPEVITLQFSETTVAHYLKQAIRFRQELAEWPFKFSLSQFGRSAESFKVLQHFPIDYAYIDASFVLALQKDPSDSENLRTVLNKLEEADVRSVVPYVENAATLASLWQMNAHYIQGFYLQAPSEAMDYEFADPV